MVGVFQRSANSFVSVISSLGPHSSVPGEKITARKLIRAPNVITSFAARRKERCSANRSPARAFEATSESRAKVGEIIENEAAAQKGSARLCKRILVQSYDKKKRRQRRLVKN